MPPVSVILVTWNGLSYTRDCLESLWATGLSRDAVLVVDNGSTDGTAATLRSSGVTVIENGGNLGFARAVNRGIRAVPADRDVVLLNNDVRVTQRDWLERLEDCARRYPNAGAIAARLVYPDGRLQDAGLRLAWSPLCIRHYGVGEPDSGQFTTVRPVPAVSFTCVWLRRHALDRVGLLDEDYFCYFEDVDLCLRLRQEGFSVLCCGEVTIVHEENATSVENRVDHHRVFTEAQRVFERKWPEAPFLSRGDVLALGYPDSDAESAAAIGRLLYGLEDLGWRVSYRNRLAWGSPLDRVNPADDWGAFLRAQQYRLPTDAPRPLVLGVPLGLHLEGSSSTCGVLGSPPDSASRKSLQAAWIGLSWPGPHGASGETGSIETIGPPVDPDYFFVSSRGSRNGPFTFLVLAPWPPKPRAEELLGAFHGAFAESREVRLLYAACGPEPRPCLNEAGVEVRWVPWPTTAERARLYREADVLIAPRTGSWRLFVAEAARCGLLILATDPSAFAPVLGPDELLVSGPQGELTSALRLAVTSAGKLAARAARAQERVESLGVLPKVLERVSARIEEHGRTEPERFPPQQEPPAGPLANAGEAPRISAMLEAGLCGNGLPPFSTLELAARTATLAVLNLHLQAGIESLAREIDHLRRDSEKENRPVEAGDPKNTPTRAQTLARRLLAALGRMPRG